MHFTFDEKTKSVYCNDKRRDKNDTNTNDNNKKKNENKNKKNIEHNKRNRRDFVWNFR